nr:MAG TPA: helix-turn-helix domain protein [Caudoviricetes sp.]
MAELYPNIYQRGRKTTLLTQEEAAERLHISPETLKRYEGGRLTPPDETVARMCEVYGVRWLALEHAKATDRLGILPELEPKPLPMATISLTNRLRDAADRLAGLLRIAEDGVIDDAERPEFDIIVQELRETIAAAYQVIYADGTKKERPDGGTSKRSVSQRFNSENDCKNSIAYSRGNASPVLKKGVYAR